MSRSTGQKFTQGQLSDLQNGLERIVAFINEWSSIPDVLREQRLTFIVKQLQESYPAVEEWIQKDTGLLLGLLSLAFPDLRKQLRDPDQAKEVITRVREHFKR